MASTHNHQRVGILGVGYVGTNLIEAFSTKFDVIGYDVSPERIDFLKAKYSDYTSIRFTNVQEDISSCDLLCIAVPTLIHRDLHIDDSCVQTASETIERYAKRGATIVMESSVRIGMTRELLGHLVDHGFYVGFSPERVDPGRTMPAFTDIPKIVSGFDNESLERIKYFYSQVFTTIVPVSSMETAEMCKLYENCFRMVNIAYANEGADACEKHNIDVNEMIEACSTKPFGFTPFHPGLGVGGHCIPVNPYYLAVNCDMPLLEAATTQTRYRPAKKACKVVSRYPHANAFVVIGAAFKPGESSTTNSPGLALYRELVQTHKKAVTLLDPFVSDASLPLVSSSETIQNIKSNAVDVVCVAMKQRNIDFDAIGSACRETSTPIVYFV